MAEALSSSSFHISGVAPYDWEIMGPESTSSRRVLKLETTQHGLFVRVNALERGQ